MGGVEFNLWKDRRWLITTLLISYFAGVTLFVGLGKLSILFFVNLQGSAWSGLAILLVLMKFTYMSYRHFIIYEQKSVSMFRWLTDFVFILLIYALFNDMLDSGRSLINMANIPFADPVWMDPITIILGVVYLLNLLWLLFRWLFHERDESDARTNLYVENMILYFVTGALLILGSLSFAGQDEIVLPMVFGIVLFSTSVELFIFKSKLMKIGSNAE